MNARFFDRFGAALELINIFDSAAYDSLLSLVEVCNPQNILEIGGGRGNLACKILTQLGNSVENYTVTEASKENVKIIRRKTSSFRNVEVVLVDGTVPYKLPLTKYDCVLSAYVLDMMSPDRCAVETSFINGILSNQGFAAVLSTTHGQSWPSKIVMSSWKMAHHVNPLLVGGSKITSLKTHFSNDNWEKVNCRVVESCFLASELLFATKSVHNSETVDQATK